jgi:tetratricopeptide (TPR) repeat protein
MHSETSSIDSENQIIHGEGKFNENVFRSIKDKNLISLQKYNSNNGNYLKVTEDGLIHKKITLKGFGKSTPLNGEEVFVNFIAELEDGRFVDNTLILKEPKQILLGINNCVPGLELGIKSMVMGEKAKIIVFPEYGYILHEELKKKIKENENSKDAIFIEKLENLKFDNIEYPSIEDSKSFELKDLKKYLPIIYDIELVRIDKPRKNREYADVTEKINEASDLKNQGNQLFREKRYQEALIKYTTGLNFFFKIPTENLIKNKLIELKHTLILNIINCHIALCEYNYALKRLLEAFEIKDTPKCYFYRSIASMNLGDFEQAQKDIEKLKSLMPNDQQVLGLENDWNNLKEKTNNEKKYIFKKGIFMHTINSADNTEKKEKDALPLFDPKNFCFFFDILINKNSKLPLKIKFEIFNIFDKREKNMSFMNYLKMLIKERKLIDTNLEIIKNLHENKEDFFYKISQLETEESENFLIDPLQFLDYDKNKYKYTYSPSEDGLLALRKNEEGKLNLVIIPFKMTAKKIENLHIVGRLFYNNNNFKNLSMKIKIGENNEIRIIDCDKSLNL